MDYSNALFMMDQSNELQTCPVCIQCLHSVSTAHRLQQTPVHTSGIKLVRLGLVDIKGTHNLSWHKGKENAFSSLFSKTHLPVVTPAHCCFVYSQTLIYYMTEELLSVHGV